MTIDELKFEDIQELVEKDEHRFLELKKTTGELKDVNFEDLVAARWRLRGQGLITGLDVI